MQALAKAHGVLQILDSTLSMQGAPSPPKGVPGAGGGKASREIPHPCVDLVACTDGGQLVARGSCFSAAPNLRPLGPHMRIAGSSARMERCAFEGLTVACVAYEAPFMHTFYPDPSQEEEFNPPEPIPSHLHAVKCSFTNIGTHGLTVQESSRAVLRGCSVRGRVQGALVSTRVLDESQERCTYG